MLPRLLRRFSFTGLDGKLTMQDIMSEAVESM